MSASALLKLQKVGFTAEQVEALADFMDTQAASKADLEAVAHRLETRIGDVRAEAKADHLSLRSELKEDISSLRSELKEDISSLHSELKDDNEDLSAELAATKSDLLKVIIGIIIAALTVNAAMMLGAMFGLAKLLGH